MNEWMNEKWRVFFETGNNLVQNTKTKLENKPLLNLYAPTKKIKGTTKNSRTCEKMDNGKINNVTLRKQDARNTFL